MCIRDRVGRQFDDLARLIGALEESFLGDLEHDCATREAVTLERRLQQVGVPEVLDRVTRHVDVHADVQPEVAPSTSLRTGEFEDARVERTHQPHLGREGQEVFRQEETAAGVVPADECLDPGRRPAQAFADRLEREGQSLPGDGRPQLGQGRRIGSDLIRVRPRTMSAPGDRAWPGTWSCRPVA